ncbi:hypothetical protein ACOMHN_065569 [Nucella lapillus]
MSPSPVEELALTDLDRSNKGASKQRRDLINAEIAVMRDLLPLSESARQRLSQLQVMSLSCVFIRKCNVLRQLFSSLPAETDMPMSCEFSQALAGFLLITTREGKLVYISENVTDYLGHSMVDMKTQGDSLYDIVDKRDVKSVQAHLTQGQGALGGTKDPADLTQRQVTFFCRMNMSRTLKRQSAFGDVKVMQVKGHFLPLPEASSSDQHQLQPAAVKGAGASPQQKYVFMATCTPLITPELKESLIQSNTMVFKTVHRMDMTYLEVTKTAEYHLDGSTEDICERSWYSSLHHWDVSEARKKHLLLIHANHEVGCMMTARMLTMKGEVIWVNMVMQVRQSSNSQSEDRVIICINQVISEEEAFQIRMQSHMFSLNPAQGAESWSPSMLGQPQPVQADAVSWMQPVSCPSTAPRMYSGSSPLSSHPVLAQALPAPVYMCGQQVSRVDQLSPPLPSSPPTAMLSPSNTGHTDKLKLMLKRKLQGPPCLPPSKVPKMVWDETVRSMESCPAGQGFEQCSGATSSLKMMGNVPGGVSWSGSTQGAASLVQQQAGRVYAVAVGLQQNVRASMLTPSPPHGSLSPPLAVTHRGTEQVVPQSGVMVAIPESCLTPDSSPASSPDPQSSATSVGKSEQNVAVALENQQKLPAFVAANMPGSLGSKAGAGFIKVEPNKEDCCHRAGRRKELPVMDASDIESFFHTLDFDIQLLAMHGQMKKQFQAPLQESSDLKSAPDSKAPVLTMQSPPHIKQEEDSISQGPLPTSQQHQQQQLKQQQQQQQLKQQQQQQLKQQQQQQQLKQQQGTVKKAEQQEQSEQQNFRELEELLSFFSGEMTATQLNLDDMLISPSAEPKGEVEAVDKEAQGGGSVCGAGHLDPFLLPSLGMDPRLHESFSPLSPSDSSADEDGNSSGGEDSFKLSNSVDGRKHGCSPLPFFLAASSPSPPSPSPQPTQGFVPGMAPHPTQDNEPGIPEEDELYQLNKLLSLMASNNGMMLSQDSQ